MTAPPLVEFWLHLAINVVFSLVVVLAVYHRRHQRRDYVFTYLLLNLITFFLTSLLSRVPLELGFALGLFGVFGILRYRTESIQVRDLTYLFVLIGMGLLNAIVHERIGMSELLVANGVVAATIAVLEYLPASEPELVRLVRYDRLDLLGPATAAALVADLEARTHLTIDRYEIGEVDLLRDVADITIYSRPPAAP